MISELRANATLGYEFGQRNFAPPGTYYLGLSLTPITNGSGYTEPPSSTGYARAAIPNNTSNWTAPNQRSVSNSGQIVFPIFTDGLALTSPATHWFLCETQTGGTAVYYGKLGTERPILKDSQIWINPNELKIQRENPA